jgi:hypothetical protein
MNKGPSAEEVVQYMRDGNSLHTAGAGIHWRGWLAGDNLPGMRGWIEVWPKVLRELMRKELIEEEYIAGTPRWRTDWVLKSAETTP